MCVNLWKWDWLCNEFSWRKCWRALCSLYYINYQIGGGGDFGDSSPRGDQVLCGLNARANAESPGLFNFDVDGNGESVQLSVYIFYGVIGLVLVNIICMAIHCWNKCVKGGSNKRKYKVVSMASDTDMEV